MRNPARWWRSGLLLRHEAAGVRLRRSRRLIRIRHRARGRLRRRPAVRVCRSRLLVRIGHRTRRRWLGGARMNGRSVRGRLRRGREQHRALRRERGSALRDRRRLLRRFVRSLLLRCCVRLLRLRLQRWQRCGGSAAMRWRQRALATALGRWRAGWVHAGKGLAWRRTRWLPGRLIIRRRHASHRMRTQLFGHDAEHEVAHVHRRAFAQDRGRRGHAVIVRPTRARHDKSLSSVEGILVHRT